VKKSCSRRRPTSSSRRWPIHARRVCLIDLDDGAVRPRGDVAAGGVLEQLLRALLARLLEAPVEALSEPSARGQPVRGMHGSLASMVSAAARRR
jgi:hypothetical protein